MWDDEEEDYDLAPQQERGGRQRQSHILDEDGLPVDNTPSISVEETIIQDEKKHRALVSRVIREGKGRGPLAKRIRYQLKFDDENYVEDIVSDCSLFRFVEGIRDGDPLRLILMPGRQALWEVDAVEAEAIRTRKLAQESLERKTRFTLDADRLTSPIGLRVLREEFPLIQLARTKGSEANDVRAMVNAYRLWAQRLHPNMHFRRVVSLLVFFLFFFVFMYALFSLAFPTPPHPRLSSPFAFPRLPSCVGAATSWRHGRWARSWRPGVRRSSARSTASSARRRLVSVQRPTRSSGLSGLTMRVKAEHRRAPPMQPPQPTPLPWRTPTQRLQTWLRLLVS
jgi:hypothetical protein